MKTLDPKTHLEDLRKTHTSFNTLIPFTDENVRTFQREFKCLRCGHCCTELSIIAIRPTEVKKLAYFLGISNNKLKHRFAVCKDGRYHLPMPCPFYDKVCKIYQVRPSVCVAYPLMESVEFEGKKYIAVSPLCPALEDLCLKMIKHRLKILKK